MITDALLNFSTDQAVTTTAVSTNTVDLGAQARDIGAGEDLYVDFRITTAFAGGTSTKFEVIVADDAALTSNVQVVGSSNDALTATLVQGAATAVRINPILGSKGKRYLGARYTVTGTNTAGKVTANLVHGTQDSGKFYNSGFTLV